MASFLLSLSILIHVVYCIDYIGVQHDDYISCNLAAGGNYHSGAITSNDICYVYCEEEYEQPIQKVYCGGAGQCIIACTYPECLQGATIFSNLATETFIYPRAPRCMKNSLVLAGGNTSIKVPIGNVNNISTEEAVYGMFVYSDYAHSISIQCQGPRDVNPANAECANMTINATTSQRFELIATSNYTNIRGANISCPDDSDYELSCFVAATGRFVMAENMLIYANEGTPEDFIFEGGAVGGGYEGVTIYCDDGSSVLGQGSDGNFEVCCTL